MLNNIVTTFGRLPRAHPTTPLLIGIAATILTLSSIFIPSIFTRRQKSCSKSEENDRYQNKVNIEIETQSDWTIELAAKTEVYVQAAHELKAKAQLLQEVAKSGFRRLCEHRERSERENLEAWQTIYRERRLIFQERAGYLQEQIRLLEENQQLEEEYNALIKLQRDFWP